MTSWLFPSDNESWGTANGMTWDNANGDPFVGCMSGLGPAAPGGSNSTAITGQSIAVTAGEPASAHVRWAGTIAYSNQSFQAKFRVTINGVTTLVDTVDYGPVTGVVDSGWLTAAGTIPSTGTLTGASVAFTINSLLEMPALRMYADSVYVNEAEAPASFGSTELRWLGLAADQTNLYLTGAGNGGTLGFKTYNLFTLGSLSEDLDFGTASFTDIDAGLRGIYPAARPTADKIAYAYGRDGTARQVLYNDMNGTLGWVDVGPGTATWGTAKIAVALMPDALFPQNVIVAFSDDDLYTGADIGGGTTVWEKEGDATTGLRCAARVFPDSRQILLGGTAAGTLLFTQNSGVTYMSGGTAAGTINAIEVSR